MFSKKKVDQNLELTHDAVMGDITQTHEHLVLVDKANKDKMDQLQLKRTAFLSEIDDELEVLQAERIKIDRSLKFFSAFAAGKESPADE